MKILILGAGQVGGTLAENLAKEAFDVTLVDNDANLGALAELWWGASCSAGDLAFIKVATGIGAGLIVNGRIFRGNSGIAGEIGHTSIDTNGPRCTEVAAAATVLHSEAC